jgi:hypothetical protein
MSIYGRYIKDYPDPRLRKFSSETEKRTLTIQVTRYAGYPHFFASLTEEGNPLWSTSENDWIYCWDDGDAAERVTHSPELSTHQQVLEWIDKTIKSDFPGDRDLEINDYTDVEANWLIKYRKEER